MTLVVGNKWKRISLTERRCKRYLLLAGWLAVFRHRYSSQLAEIKIVSLAINTKSHGCTQPSLLFSAAAANDLVDICLRRTR